MREAHSILVRTIWWCLSHWQRKLGTIDMDRVDLFVPGVFLEFVYNPDLTTLSLSGVCSSHDLPAWKAKHPHDAHNLQVPIKAVQERFELMADGADANACVVDVLDADETWWQVKLRFDLGSEAIAVHREKVEHSNY